MNIEQNVLKFKMDLLKKMPFYGDIVMNLTFESSRTIETAATNGKTIWYNPAFFSNMTEGQQNFVLMHELFHVLLRHGMRNRDNKRNKAIWNTACDLIINSMLSGMFYKMRALMIPFEIPHTGLFSNISSEQTAENLYEKILFDNKDISDKSKRILVRQRYTDSVFSVKTEEKEIPSDIKGFDLSDEESERNDKIISELIRRSASENRASMGSYYVPAEIYKLTETKTLDWKKLLKDFLSEETSDDSSYTTPERKYLHMDMILPGHSINDDKIDEIWAFVDSSGSISKDQILQFLTQLYRISRQFKCIFNICYWDTKVTDIYKKIIKEDDIFKSLPNHAGGTDINCVYNWISENKVKPDVMLILTDGYFGNITTSAFGKRLSKKTILVLNSSIAITPEIKKIGKVTRL